MLVFRQKISNFSRFWLKNVNFSSKNLKIGISQKLSRNEFLLKKCWFFVKKFQIFQKIAKNFSKFCLKNVNFSSRKFENWKSQKSSKNEFLALKNVEFCSKIANFAEKKVKVFSKIDKNVRKN